MIEIKNKGKITKETCPICRGTGLELESARLLWERKVNLTKYELLCLMYKKMDNDSYLTDFSTYVNIPITQTDIYHIIKQRGLWEPCKNCKGKGVIIKNN